MMPANEDHEEILRWRISSWRYRNAPEGFAFPGDPLKIEKQHPVAELSLLGKKLLGIVKW